MVERKLDNVTDQDVAVAPAPFPKFAISVVYAKKDLIK